MSSEVVRVRDVSRAFRSGGSVHFALRGVSMSARAGEVVVITGPSGSGKTTLLNIIGGLDSPDSGEVFLGSVRVDRLDEQARALMRREQVGFVFHANNLIPGKTAFENGEVPLLHRGENDTAHRVLESLRQVGLLDRAKALASELSGGEAQRVAVARALVHRPSVLVSDEPTASLDAATGRDVINVMLDTARLAGASLVVATHDPALIACATHTFSLKDGALV